IQRARVSCGRGCIASLISDMPCSCPPDTLALGRGRRTRRRSAYADSITPPVQRIDAQVTYPAGIIPWASTPGVVDQPPSAMGTLDDRAAARSRDVCGAVQDGVTRALPERPQGRWRRAIPHRVV